MKRVARLLPLLLAVASTACGSTLQKPTTQASAGGDGLAADSTFVATDGSAAGDGLSVSGSRATAAGTGTGSGSGAGAATGTGSASSTGGGAAGVGPSSSGSAAGPNAAGPVSTKPIRVGIVTVDVTALFAVFGAEDEAGDPYAADKAFVEMINASGGIAGRQVEAEFVLIDIQDDYNAEGQRACETFTDDKPVDIVKTNNFSNEVMLSCLEQRGVAVVDINRWSHDRGNVDHPNWLVPNAMRVDRYAPVVIDNAVDLGIMKRGDKLGVLYEDCPWGGRVYKNVVQPAAGKHGVSTEPATIKCVENLVADLGPATNQIRASVLKFRSAGVTHVLVLTGAEGFAVVMFQRAASEQQYYPKYLVTTNAFLYANGHPNRTAAIRFERDALPNMSGIGFHPMLDLGERSTPANDAQAAVQAECRQADETAGAGNRTDYSQWELKVIFYLHCDAWFTLRNVLNANGGRFGLPEVINGYRATLGSVPSALNAAGRFELPGDRLDGVGFVHPLAYDPDVGGFVHTGPARPVA